MELEHKSALHCTLAGRLLSFRTLCMPSLDAWRMGAQQSTSAPRPPAPIGPHLVAEPPETMGEVAARAALRAGPHTRTQAGKQGAMGD